MNLQEKYVFAPKTKRLYLIKYHNTITNQMDAIDLTNNFKLYAKPDHVRLFWLQVGDEIEITGKDHRLYNIRILDFVWSTKENAYKVKYHNLGGKYKNFSYGLLSRISESFIQFL